jgi:hypothetical protein
MEEDAAHANDLLTLIGRRVRTAESQQLFLTSLAYHRALGKRYFDQIWSELRSGRGEHDRIEG